MGVSDSTSGTPPAPPPTPRSPSGAFRPDALEVTLRLGDRAINSRVTSAEGELLPDASLPLRARREGATWVIDGPGGERRLDPTASVALQQGELEVRISPIRRVRFARFNLEQGDLVLPVIMLATSVLVLQVSLFWALFLQPAPDGGGGSEPSPEYIARLLEGQYDGKEQGVLAPATNRPKTGEALDSYYLQPGHDGPRDKIGGGENVGDAIRDGDKEGEEARREAAARFTPEAGGDDPPLDAPAVAELDAAAESAEAADGESDEDKPIAVHVDEGWGLTDWYDTQDARKDAQEIEKQLELARDLLRLDPDDPQGLVTRAYYEYLAFDYEAAKRTYEHFTKLYPEDPAGWNNLALAYKRQGEYTKEEAYYRIALSLAPDDDHALMNLAVCMAHQERFDEAVALMKKAEVLRPDDAYVELHWAKVHAAMGKEERAYRSLQRSLSMMRKLDTLHNIEFRQDIRVDPVFETMRQEERFTRLLDRYYGERADSWWNRKKKAP